MFSAQPFFRNHQTLNIQSTASRILPILILMYLPLMSLSGCSDSDTNTKTLDASTLNQKQELDALIDSFVETDNVVNAMMVISGETDSKSFSITRGLADPTNDEAMTAQHQFHIASMSKPFTAVLLLQLIEDGHFTLDSTLGDIFGDSTMAILFPDYTFDKSNPENVPVAAMTMNDLQQYGGESSGYSITVRQLMQHTHGMPDYTFDAPAGDESLAIYTIMGSVGEELPENSPFQGQWSGVELLEYYLASGLPSQSFFMPSKGYHYGDTGPLIAALIVHKTIGMSLAQAYRTRIFDPLSMHDTYLHHYEEPRVMESAGISHRHFDLTNLIANAGNVDVDSSGWNTSIDWAGGGLVSTAADIDRFYRGLFGGTLLRNTSVIGDTAYRVEGDDESPFYGLGFGLRADRESGTVTSYEHGGFWGSYMAYYPATGTSLVFTVNQVEFNDFDVLLQTLDRLFINQPAAMQDNSSADFENG